jgi:hypothetical protein
MADPPDMADPPAMRLLCEEKTRLFLAYQVATANYSHIVRQMATLAGAAVMTEFDLLKRQVKAARKLAGEAREQLDQHRLEHRC